MSLVLFTCLTAGAAVAGWLSGRAARQRYERDLEREPELLAPPPPKVFRDAPFAVGDAVTRSASEEVVLEGAIGLVEDGVPVAVVFFGSGARQKRVLVTFPAPREEVLWLQEATDPAPPEPPSSWDAGGKVLERSRRLPVTALRQGDVPADWGRHIVFAEYQNDQGDKGVVLQGKARRLALVGDALPLSWLERWPGGAHP
ncbi:MAG: hypothetical protein MUF34_15155 [Polyangiaceae bacterium]|jgi:hypothetical protein|nr:hypothetical protein [Polyangiaceae bacterium]